MEYREGRFIGEEYNKDSREPKECLVFGAAKQYDRDGKDAQVSGIQAKSSMLGTDEVRALPRNP